MKAPMTLRRRVTLATMMLGFVLSMLCAIAVVLVTEDYEHVLANEILRGQAEDYGLRLSNGLPASLPQTQRLSGYLAGSPNLPPAYASLPPGVHEDESNDGIHVGVFDTTAGRLVFVIDLSDIEVLEQHLNLILAGMVVFGTLVAGWLGWLFADAALKPVRRLAGSVEALPTIPVPTHLAEGVSHDDLGRLAGAIDAYHARLVDADAREQAFFADASHELRTPLAVIQGVTEVLLDDPARQPADAARLQRLDRGVHDMRHLLEAMLRVARRSPVQAETIDARSLFQDAADMALAGKPGIACSIHASGSLMVPRQEALLLIAGLARKLAQTPAAGGLHFQFEGSRLVMQVTGVEAGPGQPDGVAARADSGTGSALLDRLASRLGWRMHFGPPERIELDFGKTVAMPAAS